MNSFVFSVQARLHATEGIGGHSVDSHINWIEGPVPLEELRALSRRAQPETGGNEEEVVGKAASRASQRPGSDVGSWEAAIFPDQKASGQPASSLSSAS